MTTINKTAEDIISALRGKYKPSISENNTPVYKLKLIRENTEASLTGVIGQIDGVIVVDTSNKRYYLQASDSIVGID